MILAAIKWAALAVVAAALLWFYVRSEERRSALRARVEGAQRRELLAAAETDPVRRAQLLEEARTLWERT